MSYEVQMARAELRAEKAGAKREEKRLARLKVYVGCYDGQTSVMVAASSWKEAAKAFGIPVHAAMLYGSITGNAEQIERAMSEPGRVFSESLRGATPTPEDRK